MRYIDLYNVTPLAEALLQYKGLPYQIKKGKCPAFPDHDGPVLHDDGKWIAGTYPILGYLDRRIVWPAFFPTDQDEYAKASMVFDLFLREQPDPKDWLPIVANAQFVLGKQPCIVDLVLSRIKHKHSAWAAYQERVNSTYSKLIRDDAA